MNSTNYWKVGAFVLGGIVLAFGALVWLGAGDWNRKTRTIVTYFDESVQGLEVGAALKFRGVPIGSVTEITIAPDLRHVKVTAQVYEDVLQKLGLAGKGPVLSEMEENRAPLRIQVASAGITGVKFLLVDYFDPRRFPVQALPFDPGPDYMPSTPSTLKSIEEAVVDVGMQLPLLTMRASETLVRLTDVAEDFEKAIRPLLEKNGAVSQVLSQYERTGAQLERTAQALENEVKNARLAETTGAVREAASSVTGFTAEGSAFAEDARGSLSALQDSLEAVRALAEYLERDPASIVRGRATPQSDGSPRP
ncbi:MAG: MlaD family protein [bacterium]